jgi:hypothetical protein
MALSSPPKRGAFVLFEALLPKISSFPEICGYPMAFAFLRGIFPVWRRLFFEKAPLRPLFCDIIFPRLRYIMPPSLHFQAKMAARAFYKADFFFPRSCGFLFSPELRISFHQKDESCGILE